MVAHPVVFVFAAAPVTPDEPCEALRAALAAWQAGDVDMPGTRGFAVGGGGGFVDDDQAAGMGQFNLGRLDRPGFYFAFFETSVAFVGGAGKKGGSPAARPSAVLWAARLSSLAWTR